MIKTTKEYYPIETEINCYAKYNSMYDLSFEDDDDRQFITDFANGKFQGSDYSQDKNHLFEIKDDEDFDDFIHDNFCDEDLLNSYCEWLDKKYPSHDFFLHTIHTDDDCYFVIEANKKLKQ